mmetsp:Transcript_25534/g.48302  ORF Transcript_25534/g.48302 Transcript_25534/m.48302 type:complete len:106 (-) Transcript_25534:1338-1655(-)
MYRAASRGLIDRPFARYSSGMLQSRVAGTRAGVTVSRPAANLEKGTGVGGAAYVTAPTLAGVSFTSLKVRFFATESGTPFRSGVVNEFASNGFGGLETELELLKL